MLVSVGMAWVEMQGKAAGEAEARDKAAVGVSGFDQDWALCLWAAQEEAGVGWRLHGCVGPSW